MPAAHGATITSTPEDDNLIEATIQLINGRGKPLVGKAVIDLYVSTDADGLEAVDFSDDGLELTVGVSGALIEDTDGVLKVVSDEDGRIDLNIADLNGEDKVRYVNAVLGNGAVLPAHEIEFTD